MGKVWGNISRNLNASFFGINLNTVSEGTAEFRVSPWSCVDEFYVYLLSSGSQHGTWNEYDSRLSVIVGYLHKSSLLVHGIQKFRHSLVDISNSPCHEALHNEFRDFQLCYFPDSNGMKKNTETSQENSSRAEWEALQFFAIVSRCCIIFQAFSMMFWITEWQSSWDRGVKFWHLLSSSTLVLWRFWWKILRLRSDRSSRSLTWSKMQNLQNSQTQISSTFLTVSRLLNYPRLKSLDSQLTELTLKL